MDRRELLKGLAALVTVSPSLTLTEGVEGALVVTAPNSHAILVVTVDTETVHLTMDGWGALKEAVKEVNYRPFLILPKGINVQFVTQPSVVSTPPDPADAEVWTPAGLALTDANCEVCGLQEQRVQYHRCANHMPGSDR